MSFSPVFSINLLFRAHIGFATKAFIASRQQSCSRGSVASNLFELLMIHFLVLCVLLLEAPRLSAIKDDVDEVVEQIDENNFTVAVAAKS